MVATLLIYFIFWGARAEDRTRGCLTAARRATCMLRRHPCMLRRHPKCKKLAVLHNNLLPTFFPEKITFSRKT